MWTERAARASFQSQDVRTAEQEVEHQRSRHELRKSGSNGCASHSHVSDIDKEVVEDHVQCTSHDVQYGGNLHVAGAFQHRTAQPVHLEEDAAEPDNGEINGSVMGYLLRASQPIGKWTTDENAGYRDDKTENQTTDQCLA